MSTTVTNDAIKYAISDGQRLWTQAIQISKHHATPDVVAREFQHRLEDGVRAIARDTLFTPAEIAARYEQTVEGPFSCTPDPDVPEDEEPRYLPLDDARVTRIGYYLHWKPRRKPLPGAVYVARQPLEGEELSIPLLVRAFRAVEAAHGGPPREVRLSHRDFTDYLNLLTCERRFFIDDGGVTLNGVPVKPQPRAPRLTLLAVYPLPGIGA